MIIFRQLNKKIVGTCNGKPFNLPNTPENLASISEMQRNSELDTATFWQFVKDVHNGEVAGANEYLIYKPITNEYFLTYKGIESKIPMPKELATIIERSYDKDVDFLPVIKMWARLLTSPYLKGNPDIINYLSTYISTTWVDHEEMERLIDEEEYQPEAAKEMCTYQDIAITQEGLLATYKVADIVTWEFVVEYDEEKKEFVKIKNPLYVPIPPVICPTTGDELEPASFTKPEFAEDLIFTPAIITNGDKFYSNDKIGYVYKVGEMQWLPKDATRNLSNSGGGGGLYSGGLRYIDGFKSEGTHVLTCFVNPADIISFQSQGHAFRTDALFPNNVWDEDVQLKSPYHSSDYGEMSTKRIAKLMEAAVKAEPVADEDEDIISE